MRRLKAQQPVDDSLEPGGEFDNWATPPWAVVALMPHLLWRRAEPWVVVDPGAGTGVVTLTALAHGLQASHVLGVELHPGRARLCAEQFDKHITAPHTVMCADWTHNAVTAKFHAWVQRIGRPALIIGNPPCTKPRDTIGLEFVEWSLRAAGTKGCVALLLPLDFASGVERYDRVHANARACCYPLRRRPSFGSTNGSSSGQRPVAWFVWDALRQDRGDFRVL